MWKRFIIDLNVDLLFYEFIRDVITTKIKVYTLDIAGVLAADLCNFDCASVKQEWDCYR